MLIVVLKVGYGRFYLYRIIDMFFGNSFEYIVLLEMSLNDKDSLIGINEMVVILVVRLVS